MKLHEPGSRRGKGRPQPRSKELLEFEVPASDGFNIRQDVTPQNWEQVEQAIRHRIDTDSTYTLASEVKELVLLGSENRTSLDMEKMRHFGKGDALSRLDSILPNVFEAGSWESLCGILIELAVIDPSRITWLREERLPEDVQVRLWQRLENKTWKNSPARMPNALALFLLFPEKREYIRQVLDLAAMQAKLEEFLDTPMGGFLMEQAMGFGIIFPGKFKSRLTRERWQQVCEKLSMPKGDLSLSAITAFHLLSADDVRIDEQGKVSVIHVSKLSTSTRPVPERSQM